MSRRLFRRPAPVRPARLGFIALEDRVVPTLVGRLDPLFDGDGKNSFGTFVGTDDIAAAVAFQPDGRFVVAGTVVNPGGNEDIQILRFNANGTTDFTFAGTGRVFVAFDLGGTNNDRANAVAIQPDGKIVVAGFASTASNGNDVAVVRLNTNGSLDTSFDGDGKATVGVNFGGNFDDVANAVLIQPDKNILIGGSAGVGPTGDTDFLVVRLTATGALDTTLQSTIGKPGIFQYTVTSGVELVTGVGLQPDGKIIAVGSTTRAGNRDFSVTRITADGQFDNSGAFQGLASGSGFKNTVLVDFGGKDDRATAVHVSATGTILVAGSGASATSNGTDFALLRLNADGSPDTTFDSDGKLLVPFDNGGGTRDDSANAMFVQPDGRIVAAGFSSFSGTDKDFAITRRNADGSPDTTFDGDGRSTYLFDSGGGNVDVALGAALDPNGRIVLVGTASTDTNGNELALVRVFGQDVPLVVSTTADEADGNISAGKLSLREAITLATLDPDDNAITFAAGLTGTITLGSDLPAIIGNTTITGPGANKLAVSGNDVNRVFVVNDQTASLINVSISGLTLTRGRATSSTGGASATLGGAIFSQENLTLTDVAVTDNKVNGAIFHSTGTLTVIDGTFSGNQNNNSAAAILSDGATLFVVNSAFTNNSGNGRGAIFTNKDATISDSSFMGNAATGGGGGGGAIYHRAGTLTVNGGSFTGNTTTTNGGAINTEEGILSVIRSTFTGNMAANNGGAIFSSAESTLADLSVSGGTAGVGAGLFNNGAAAKMTVTNSTISGNSGFAAGIRNESGTVTISNSTISGNTGSFNTGLSNFQGTMTVANSTVSGNISTASGGGISNSGTLTLANTTVANNRDDSDGVGGDGGGGGLRNISGGTATLTNTIIAGNFTGTGNAASDVFDGAVGVQLANSKNNLIGDAGTAGGFTNGANGNRVGVNAGLLPLANYGGSTQTHALLAGSPAVNAGAASALSLDQRGAPRSIGGAVDIGAFELVIPTNLIVDNAGDADDGNFAAGQLTLREAIGLANARTGADTITFATGLGDIVLASAQLAMTDTTGATTITGPATGTQVVTRSAAGGTPLFRIFSIGSAATANMSGLTISNGNTKADGGGIFNIGTVTLTNSTLSGNTASVGGGISNFGTVTLTNSTLSGNTTTNAGGGIRNTGTATLTNSTLAGNTATQDGGGIRNTGTVTLTNSTLSGNTASVNGGGVSNGGTVTISNSTLAGNTANGNGGGIRNFGGTVTLTNTIVAGNLMGTTANDVSGALVNTSANNLIGDAANAGGLTNGANGNIVGVAVADVINTTLANNGGPTLTHALNPNGPALGTGSKAFMTATDQRGFMRPADPTFFPDIGAVEPQLLALAPPALLNGTINAAYNQTLTASLAGLPAGTTFTFQIASGSLPAGLTLSSGGTISGTPTTAGTANFQIVAFASTGDLALPTARSITIVAVNSPPTISDIVNQTGAVGAVIGPIGFTVADAQTPAGALSVTGASSNTALVPVNGISFGGSGGDRTVTVTVTPAAGQTGTATITVTVTDGNGAMASDTFVVTVSATPAAPNPLLVGFREFAVGADVGGSTVSFFNAAGTLQFSVTPFPGFTGGVRTAAADFNGDGVADIVAGTGPGRATRVVVLDGVSKQELFAVDPFEPAFTGGVYVTAGDVNGDGVPDIAITPDEGGGPRVDVYSGGQNFARIASFFGIDDANFRGGARASIADMSGDGVGDLIVVAGFGGGPRVAGFDGTTLAKSPEKIFGDFFAFEQTLRNGIFVTAGDLNGDGFADLIAGGGPGGGPRVLAFDGKSLLTNQYVNLANFFGGDSNGRGGIRLAVKDLDGDGQADLVVGSGTGAGSRITGYLGKTFQESGTPPAVFDFDGIAGFTGGVFVG